LTESPVRTSLREDWFLFSSSVPEEEGAVHRACTWSSVGRDSAQQAKPAPHAEATRTGAATRTMAQRRGTRPPGADGEWRAVTNKLFRAPATINPEEPTPSTSARRARLFACGGRQSKEHPTGNGLASIPMAFGADGVRRRSGRLIWLRSEAALRDVQPRTVPIPIELPAGDSMEDLRDSISPSRCYRDFSMP
jgi:hypothetical protein